MFLHDVPSHLYETDLLQALTLRKEGVRASHSPQPPQNAVIVTGRQTDSYESTKLWLEANGLGGRELHVRDPNKYASEETGKYKAHTIERLGLTHFMESEPLQALQIAELVPWVHVLQWNLEDRTPRWVRATQASTLPNLGS